MKRKTRIQHPAARPLPRPAAPLPSELDLAQRVEKVVLASHPTGVTLLHELTAQANSEIARIDSVVRIDDVADHFRLIVLAQSINAAWMIARMIRIGYPRIALANARLLREGHIAILWAKAFPEEARIRWRQIGLPDSPPWPKSGDMAMAIERTLQEEGMPTETVARWGPFMLAVGNTHNREFAHAVTDFALGEGFSRDGAVISPLIGPTYVSSLTERAIDHMIPLFKIVLNDAANLQEELRNDEREALTVRLLDEADKWWQEHPIPLSEIPQYTKDPSEFESGKSENTD